MAPPWLPQAAAKFPDNADLSKPLSLLGDTLGKLSQGYARQSLLGDVMRPDGSVDPSAVPRLLSIGDTEMARLLATMQHQRAQEASLENWRQQSLGLRREENTATDAYRNRSLDLTEGYRRDSMTANQDLRRDALEQGRYTWQPGTGLDPATNQQTPGMYRLPMRGGPDESPQFYPGQTITPRSGGAAAHDPARIREARTLVEQGAAPDFTTAYSMVRSGVRDGATWQRLIQTEKKQIGGQIGNLSLSDSDLERMAVENIMRRQQSMPQGPGGMMPRPGAAPAMPGHPGAPMPAPMLPGSPGGYNSPPTPPRPMTTAPQTRPPPQAAPYTPPGGLLPRPALPPAQVEQTLNAARAAIAAGKDRNAVMQRLRENGIDPSGL